MKRLLLLLSVLIAPLCGAQDSGFKFQDSGFELKGAMPVFHDKMKAELDFPLAWERGGIADFDVWRKVARAKVLELMQNVQRRPEDWEMEIKDEEQREGYRALKIEFNLSTWSRVPAYVLVPDGEGRHPAVVLLHDHGAHFLIGKEKMIRPFGVEQEIADDAEAWSKGYEGQFPGDYLAAHGYVVIAVDALLWGERSVQNVDKKGRPRKWTRQEVYDVQQALAANFLQMGSSWGAFINQDDILTAEFTASLPWVDPDRIGSMGWSMGAYRSWMLSALSDVVKASANVCWMNTTDSLMTLTNNQNRGGSAYSMLIPGLRRWMDYPHVASIACPKPTLFFNGTQDKLFPVGGVKDAYATMRQTWESQGAGDRFVGKLFDTPHTCNREMQGEILEFFDKWLKGEGSKVKGEGSKVKGEGSKVKGQR